MARTISHSFAALTHEILFLPLEHKIHIFSLPCNILYISISLCFNVIYWTARATFLFKLSIYCHPPSNLCSATLVCLRSVNYQISINHSINQSINQLLLLTLCRINLHQYNEIWEEKYMLHMAMERIKYVRFNWSSHWLLNRLPPINRSIFFNAIAANLAIWLTIICHCQLTKYNS